MNVLEDSLDVAWKDLTLCVLERPDPVCDAVCVICMFQITNAHSASNLRSSN